MPTAEFRSRDACIACGGGSLVRVAGGRFGAEPLRSFISADPWGTSPLPYVEQAPWELLRCGTCRQRFHRYVLAAEWDARRFDEWMGPAVHQFEQRRGVDHEAALRAGRANAAHVLRIELLTRPVRHGAPVRFLDFGCGWGRLPAMAALFGFEAWGVDRDAWRRRDAAPGFRLCAGLEEVEGRFHAASLMEVLEHLVDPMAVLRAVHDRLVPGGILVVETPDCTRVRGIATAAEYRAIHPLDHVNAFDPPSLRRFVERAGFRVVTAPTAYLAAEPLRLARAAARSLLARLRPTTQLYCQRV
ncbi:class I SAM-dependent methyltransferase [Anaeromyxobacter sp. PSR-1]|uniref:class I SAM-dependent methyltransferase n=1 Tax=unclassified Anaeromyxobacter TaxID=2620896 RepID=UPI0005E264B6|nr:class I SAM-dependent methyltransferase [Anaeromyxobacter sp. PSR-1]GAO03670.1 ubiquinone biosynthesis O-methyltransferase [Anaeromyxobacter sp. PSR-1]